MDLSRILAFFKNFETGRIIQFLKDLDVGQLVHNPWLLGGVGLLAMVALFMRWRLLLTTLVGVTGFVWLTAYTVERGTTLDGLGNQNLLVFVGGGIVVIFVVIYLLFIKTD
jgi:hypothetical protein